MWLYTSYAVQPHRSVASKNGDFRYQGPKYKVLEATSGIALALPLTGPPSFTEDASAGQVRADCPWPAAGSESLFPLIDRARGDLRRGTWGRSAGGRAG